MTIGNNQITQQKFSPRPYQKEAIGVILEFTGERIRAINTAGRGYFDNACLLEMATGSGKTFTVGRYIEKIFSLRDRHRALKEKFSRLTIVVLSNRIDGVTQFRDDLIHGRNGEKGKPPVLSKKIIEQLKVSTYHSRADGEDLNIRDGHDDTEVENISGSDEIIFSTHQTAYEKELAKKLSHIDILIIDEAHNVRPNTDFFYVIESLARLTNKGYAPIILPITATPTNTTKELFGDEKYHFGIGEYLASGYAPKVEYHVVTAFHADNISVGELVNTIRKAKESSDIEEKSSLVKEARNLFEGLMARDVSTEKFARDIIERLSIEKNGKKEIEPTIIFARSIHDADQIAEVLRREMGVYGSVLSYHSRNDENMALEKLIDPEDPCRIVIAVDKLNESIDLPVVSNIVFYRYTEDAKIYLQQFGRGLRGDGIVRYYDYIGGMSNFSWIGAIQEKYMAAIRSQREVESVILPDNSSDSQGTMVGLDKEFPIVGVPLSEPIFRSFAVGDFVGNDVSTLGPAPRAVTITSDVSPLEQPLISRGHHIGPRYQIVVPSDDISPDMLPSKDDDIVFASEELFSDLGDIDTLLGSEHRINLADLGLFINEIAKDIEKQRTITLQEVVNFLKNYRTNENHKPFYGDWQDTFHILNNKLPMRDIKQINIRGVPLTKIPAIKAYLRGNKSKWCDFLRMHVFPHEIQEQKRQRHEYAKAKGEEIRKFLLANPGVEEAASWYQYRPSITRVSIPGLEKDIDVYMELVGYPASSDLRWNITQEELYKFCDWIKNRGYITMNNTN